MPKVALLALGLSRGNSRDVFYITKCYLMRIRTVNQKYLKAGFRALISKGPSAMVLTRIFYAGLSCSNSRTLSWQCLSPFLFLTFEENQRYCSTIRMLTKTRCCISYQILFPIKCTNGGPFACVYLKVAKI